MMKKMVGFIVLAFLAVPVASFAQSPSSPEKSIENLNVADIPSYSIVVLSKEETDVAGYFHQKYAFRCLGELKLVDYYGPAFDPKDRDVLWFERMMCARQRNNDYEGSE
jgi:hypothetical protein